MSSVNLLVGIVTYRTGPALDRCIASVLSDPVPEGLRICVVDNDPASGEARAAAARYPQVTAVDSPVNVGFGAGMNRAFESHDSRYFLVLNPDTEVSPGALRGLVDFLDRHPKVAVVGPQLRFPDGRLHPSARRFPRLDAALLEVLDLNLWFPGNRTLGRHTYQGWRHDSVRCVDWVTGAALMVRSDLFAQVGGFDERFFMYSEEVDLCRRIAASGWRVAVEPGARVTHVRGHSTRMTDVRQVCYYQSLHAYFRKHHGPRAALAVRAAVLLRQLLYIPAVIARYLPGRRWRPLRARVGPAFRLLAWACGLGGPS